MGAAAQRITAHSVEDIIWDGHSGPQLGHADGYDIIACQCCGFAHAVPLPDPAELEREYAEAYYRDAKPTYLSHADEDAAWARLAHEDKLAAISGVLGRSKGSLIEIGSGPGHFLETATTAGWTALGIEPSHQAAAHTAARGLKVRNCTFEAAVAEGLPQVDAIVTTNVLEHVRDPAAILATARDLLVPGGVICVTVPNDFSPLQKVARDGLGLRPWWVAPPHHLNYFDFDSLAGLLTRLGFAPKGRLTNFPMEAYLLMGEDYVSEPSLGRTCHTKRKSFDLAFEAAGQGDARRRLYAALADAGMGREATIIAVKS